MKIVSGTFFLLPLPFYLRPDAICTIKIKFGNPFSVFPPAKGRFQARRKVFIRAIAAFAHRPRGWATTRVESWILVEAAKPSLQAYESLASSLTVMVNFQGKFNPLKSW